MPTDTRALYLLLSDETTAAFLPFVAVKTLDDAALFLQEKMIAKGGNGCRFTAVCLKDTNEVVGYISLSDTDSYDLGYALRREWRQMGFISEACRAVIQRAKADGIPFITATHDRNNPASGAVMKRIGMRYQYSYEELWQPKNKLVTFRMYQLNLACKHADVYKKYWEKYPVHFIETEGV